MRKMEIVKRVEHWQARLLPEWRAGVRFGEPPDGVHRDDWAMCTVSDQTIPELTIWVRYDAIKDQADGDIDRMVVHELLHAPLDVVLNFGDQALEVYAGEMQLEIVKGLRRNEMEEFVNRMAHAIVDRNCRGATRHLTG